MHNNRTTPAHYAVGGGCGLLILVVVYLASYVALSDFQQINEDRWVVYRLPGGAIEGFYEPAHRLDRLLRPNYWDGDEPVYPLVLE